MRRLSQSETENGRYIARRPRNGQSRARRSGCSGERSALKIARARCRRRPPRPTAPVAAAFANSLEASLDKAAAASADPGRPAIHRLNRAEYSNAVRDLLAVDIKPGSLLPADDSGYGFDNIGDVLSVSPALLERYMSVARTVSRLAVGDTAIKPGQEEFAATRPGARGARNERVSDDLPFDSRGGLSFQYYFPVDAEYVIKVKLGNANPGANQTPTEIRLPVRAGLRTVGATFLKESAKPEVPAGRGPRGASARSDARRDPHGALGPASRWRQAPAL